ncbi:MAG: 16S rRNA (guanine(527)-N(7))-methyltransferase RsmG [Acidobacteriota bacterium]
MRNEFIAAIREYQEQFGVELPDEKIEKLADYYELVLESNSLLHLVGPCSPTEFATRHVLESLTLFRSLPARTSFADIGSGAGLPSIPCLIARDDLRATLIESKEKKTTFLHSAAERLGLGRRVTITNKQFAEAVKGQFSAVTCRALDKFAEKLPGLVKWAGRRDLLLFGGPTLRTELEKLKIEFDAKLMPLSERRYLFISRAR